MINTCACFHVIYDKPIFVFSNNISLSNTKRILLLPVDIQRKEEKQLNTENVLFRI
jgi:hypothetical protein